jgi:hypothetical protein
MLYLWLKHALPLLCLFTLSTNGSHIFINRYFFLIYRKCLPFASTWVHLGFLVGSVLLIFLVFCVVLLCVFTFWVPCCGVRYDFRINTLFGLSLSPVVLITFYNDKVNKYISFHLYLLSEIQFVSIMYFPQSIIIKMIFG